MSTYVGLPEPEEFDSILATQQQPQAEPALSVIRDATAFSAIIETVEDHYLRANGRKCGWSPLALRQVKELLDAHPRITATEWKSAVKRRYAGPKAARQTPPVQFIPKLHLYLIND